MTRQLQSQSRPARSGETKSVVIFLHGYGADGPDLLGIADVLGEHLPDTAFHAPNAPTPSAANPAGFQWFPIPRMDGSTEAEAADAMVHSVADVDAYIDAVLKEEGITEAHLALFGFSQGTMMALHVAPRRTDEMAGVVAFSGRLIRPEALEASAVSRPPILLVHGDADDVVPPQSLPQAAQALTDAGFKVYTHVMKGTGHGIAPDGLSVALAFLRDVLGYDES